MKYKLIFFFSLVIFANNLFAQAKPNNTKPQPSTTGTTTSGPQYLVPVSSTQDTVEVFAVLVNPNFPLEVKRYNVITKSWVYEDGKKNVGEQWIENQSGVKIPEWRKLLLWLLPVKDYPKQ